jgi:hypothetical protein
MPVSSEESNYLGRLPLTQDFFVWFAAISAACRLAADEPATPPLNDRFHDAIRLTGTPATAASTTSGATHEPGEAAVPCNTAGQTVWWTWTAPASGLLRLSVAEDAVFSTALGVFAGDAVDSLELLASNRSDWGITCVGAETRMRGQIEVTVTGGHTYHVAADWHTYRPAGYLGLPDIAPCVDCPSPVLGGPVSFSLEFIAAPTNDTWAAATSVTGNHATLGADTAGAGIEPGEPNGLFHTVWWSWTAPRSGLLAFGNNLPAPKPAPTAATLQAHLPTPAYDNPLGWPAGVVIPIGTPNHDGTGGDSTGVIIQTGGGVIDIFPPVQCGVAVELNPPPPFLPAVRLFSGPSLDHLTPLGGGSVTNAYTARVEAGTTYFFALGSTTPAMGMAAFEFQLTAPENDNFAARLPLTGTVADATGHNVGATVETSEPVLAPGAAGHSVWWTWTAPDDGLAEWTVTSTNFNPTLALFRGGSLSSLQLEGSSATGSLIQRVAAGETWQLAVDGTAGHEEGDYGLALKVEPLAPELASPPTRQADGSRLLRVDHLRGRGILIFAASELSAWAPIWAGVVNADTATFRDYTAQASDSRYYVVRLAVPGEEHWFIPPPAPGHDGDAPDHSSSAKFGGMQSRVIFEP